MHEVKSMIGARLQEQRKIKNKKQKELADAIGVHLSMISRYETDRDSPSDAVKVKIALFLEVSLDYLLGVIDEPVAYYNKNIFELTKELEYEDIMLLKEFVDYLKYRKKARTKS